MNELLHNLEQLAVAIESERDLLDLLAFFRREDRTDWELVCSAQWAVENKRDSIAFIAQTAAKIFPPHMAADISSIVILDRATDFLASFLTAPGEYRNLMLNGVEIADAIFARLRQPPHRVNRATALTP